MPDAQPKPTAAGAVIAAEEQRIRSAKRIGLNLPDHEYEDLVAAMSRLDVTATWFIRKAVKFAIRNPAAFGRFLTGANDSAP